jgi:tripartite-type tricarboxylate transporter receptor subunit TctC
MQDKPVNTAKNFPDKPITIIVPYPAGGSMDMLARAMEKLAVKYLGQPLVILNIPGGAATIGWNELAGAKPDGYTIGVTSANINLQPLYGSTRYHYPTALEPLTQFAKLPIAVVVRSDQPWKNIDDLVHYAKQHPGEIKYAHSGLGTAVHVVAEMFSKEAGINIDQVPFRGEAEMLAALLGGHVQVMITTTAAIKEHVKSGNVRVLAVATAQRLSEADFKTVPTFKEQGLDVVFDPWFGIGVPKGLPEDVKAKLVEGLNGMIHDPQFRENLEVLGMTIEYLGPQESAAKWISETERFTKIVKETGIAERIAAQKTSKDVEDFQGNAGVYLMNANSLIPL